MSSELVASKKKNTSQGKLYYSCYLRDLWAVHVYAWGRREEVGNSLSQVLQLLYVGVSRILKGNESILYVNCILSR